MDNKQTCKGLSEDGSKCRMSVNENKQCCLRVHSDMEDYTDDMFNNLKKCTFCSRPRWRYFPASDRCIDCQNKQTDIQIYCLAKMKDCKTNCRLKIQDGNRFCLRNHSYMETYTDDMLLIDNLKQCSQCRRHIYKGHYKTGMNSCNSCLDIKKKKVVKVDNRINCDFENCKNYQYNGSIFCKSHRLEQLKIDAKKNGQQLCAQYNRKCITPILPDNYDKKSCPGCLKKAAIIDNKRYDVKKKKIIKERENDNYTCILCNTSKNGIYFQNDKETSLKCIDCRKKQLVYNRNRIRKNYITDERQIKEKKRCAEKRNISYNISDEFALELLHLPCVYCGIYNSKINDEGIEYSLMTFDRIDSNLFYTKHNVVSSCAMCNYMKYTHTDSDFITYCHNIFNNFGSKNKWINKHNVKCIKISKHNNDCKGNNRETEITQIDIDNITAYKCYYCNNTNRTNQIGIDRINSNLGYVKNNTLVACCSICNYMKKDHDINDFYNHILKILLFKNKITQEQYDDNYKTTKRLTKTKKIVEDISKIYDYDGKTNRDRRNMYTFLHESKIYINKIWKGYNINCFYPEIEFCETKEQIDIWMFYRVTISSHFPSKKYIDTVKILIRDKFTKTYIGITSLTVSRPNWSVSTSIGKILRHTNVYNISTCVSIPPFSYNFNGGKLITMLMFSDEVLNYMKDKNIIIAGLMTYSLHGTSIQYDGIDNFNLIGYTNINNSGKDNTRVPQKVYDNMLNHMRSKNIDIGKTREINIKKFCSKYGVPDASIHGTARGIYFGKTGDSLEYLYGNTGEFTHNLNNINDIYLKWYVKHAIPRFADLIKRNSIMTKVNYDKYYIDNDGKDRSRKFNTRKDNDELIKYVVYKWFSNNIQKIYTNNIKECIINDKAKIQKIINGFNYSKHIKDELKQHMNICPKFIKLNKCIDKLIEFEINFLHNKNKISNKYTVNLKKSRIFLTTQLYDNINKFTKLYNINNLKKGKWNVYTNNNNILNMMYDNIDITRCSFTKIVINANNIYKLCISQKDKEFYIDNLWNINTPIKITKKNNIFIDIYRTNIFIYNNLEIVLGKMDNNLIVSIEINKLINNNMSFIDKINNIKQNDIYDKNYNLFIDGL